MFSQKHTFFNSLLADVPGSSDSNRATLLLALELYREGRVSLGRAAELAGVGIEEFMEFSAHRQVSLHYGEADLAEDHVTAERLSLASFKRPPL